MPTKKQVKKEKDYTILKVKIPKGYTARLFETMYEKGNQQMVYVYCEPEVKFELLEFGITPPKKKTK